MKLSIRTIDYLKDVVTGDKPGGLPYRSGPKLVELFNRISFSSDSYGQGFPSRWSYAKDKILEINNTPNLATLIKEVLSPIYFIDNEECLSALVIEFNKFLAFDGYSIAITNNKCRILSKGDKKIVIENKEQLEDDFIQEQIEKCEKKLIDSDYDGAITNSRSLVEGVFSFVYKRVCKEDLPKTGDLRRDYKVVRDLLGLENHQEESVRQILNGFAGIIYGVDTLSNQMGDRHKRKSKPERYHAKLAINSAKTIVDFIFDVYKSGNY